MYIAWAAGGGGCRTKFDAKKAEILSKDNALCQVVIFINILDENRFFFFFFLHQFIACIVFF